MSKGEVTNSTTVLHCRYNILMMVTILLGVVSTIITVLVSEANVRNFQIQKIRSYALMIDTQRVESLAGNQNDIYNPVYQGIKDQLMRVRQVNPEMRFLYLMRSQDNKIIFLVDSEDPNSADYSAPGDEYNEASEVFKSAFSSLAKTGFELYRDRWGYWLSSFAPIIDVRSGNNIAVLGADIDAYSQYFFPIAKAAMLPVIAFLFLFIILWINRKFMLFQTEAVNEKEAILHVISHEVRTPLSEIRLACEMMMDEKDFEQNTLVKRSVTQIFKSSMQMIQRVHNLEKANTLSEATKLDLQSVNIGDFINKTLYQYAKIAKVGEVELKRDLSGIGMSDYIQADPELLELAIQNVFFNLILYADPGTVVSINCHINKNLLEIVSSGQGSPIPLEELNLVFAGYHQGVKFSHHTEGTGIGLFLAKKIITLHHGDINVSVKDNNTIFTIQLPLEVKVQ